MHTAGCGCIGILVGVALEELSSMVALALALASLGLGWAVRGSCGRCKVAMLLVEESLGWMAERLVVAVEMRMQWRHCFGPLLVDKGWWVGLGMGGVDERGDSNCKNQGVKQNHNRHQSHATKDGVA